MDEEEPAPVTVLATCHTESCPAMDGGPCPENGIPHQVTCYANAEPPTYRVLCIQCNDWVTDLVVVE